MATSPKIIVTGANGQLGKELKQLEAKYPNFEFIFLSKEDLPIHHSEMVEHFFSVYRPTFLINCAAYTAVDRAEEDRENAFLINAYATGVLAEACKKYHAKFIHISTDYVFDGTATAPYKEEASINPQGVYGTSKAEGEKLALSGNADTIIIRTAWVYSIFGKNFVKTMMKLMQEREELKVVDDQIGSPTYAADLAEVILQIISSGQWHPGIYHYSNDGIISWFDFAAAIKEIGCFKCSVVPIPTTAYPTPAKRPAYSVLDKTKIKNTFHITIPGWKDSLKKCMAALS